MAQRTLIKGGTVISVDPAVGDFETGDVLIENGAIAAVGARIDAGDAEVIDATDRIVLPGLIDTHRHTWQALFRNIGSDWTLAHYFTGLHGTMSQLYRPEDTYAGNLIGTLEALDGGITTLLDWSHNLNTPEHSDAAIEALQETRLARDLRARLRLRALGAGELAAARRGHPPRRAASTSPRTTSSSRSPWRRAATSSRRST